MNNAVYADWVDEAVAMAEPGGSELVRSVPRQVRLEYALAAEPAERLERDVAGRIRLGVPIVRTAAGADLLRARIEAG